MCGLKLGVGKGYWRNRGQGTERAGCRNNSCSSNYQINKNYNESGFETVTGISKLLLQVKEATSVVWYASKLNCCFGLVFKEEGREDSQKVARKVPILPLGPVAWRMWDRCLPLIGSPRKGHILVREEIKFIFYCQDCGWWTLVSGKDLGNSWKMENEHRLGTYLVTWE